MLATSTSKVQLSTPHPPPPGHLNHMSYQYLYNISGQITTVKPLLTDTSVYNLDTSLSWIQFWPQLFKRWIELSTGQITIQQRSIGKPIALSTGQRIIHRIGAIHLLNNWGLHGPNTIKLQTVPNLSSTDTCLILSLQYL